MRENAVATKCEQVCDGCGAAVCVAANDCDDFFLALGSGQAKGGEVCLLEWVGVDICLEA